MGELAQLVLPLWPAYTLRGCLSAYIAAVSGKITSETLGDYNDRAAWMCDVVGECVDVRELTFARVERLVLDWGPAGRGLKFVTLRKRLRLTRAAMLYAADHGLLPHHAVFRMPPQLCDDGERRRAFHTPEQF